MGNDQSNAISYIPGSGDPYQGIIEQIKYEEKKNDSEISLDNNRIDGHEAYHAN